jgi:hypothetical protein
MQLELTDNEPYKLRDYIEAVNKQLAWNDETTHIQGRKIKVLHRWTTNGQYKRYVEPVEPDRNTVD